MTQKTFKFSEMNIKQESKGLLGDKIKIERIINRQITVEAFQVKPSKFDGECLYLQLLLNGNRHVVFTGSKSLMNTINRVPKDSFPFETTIIKGEDDSFQFS